MRLLTMLLGGCVLPIDTDTDTASTTSIEGDWAGSGSVSADGFLLDWWWESPWDEGVCVSMLLHNQGGALDAWLATISLRGEVSSWLGGYGGAAVLSSAPDEIQLSPYSGALAAGEVVEVSYCAEPHTEPAGLLVFSSPADDTAPSSDTTTSPIAGSLYSDDGLWGLSYQGGADHGSTESECLLLTFWNFSGQDVSDWSATVGFSGIPSVDFSWSLTVFEQGSELSLHPDSTIAAIPAGGIAEAGVCMEPMVAPLSLHVESN